MSSYLRKLVSGPKARHVDEELHTDLDLAYITDQLIIMGWPATHLEAIYRNSRKDVKRFLENHHKGKYRVYNLVPVDENDYQAAAFDGRVSRFPFPDHHPPPLSLIPMLVVDMTEWLKADAENVAVIHCKAGKGRSGTMACSYLLSLPVLPSAPQEAWKLGKKRDKSGHGAERSGSSSQMQSDLTQAAEASMAGSSQNKETSSGMSMQPSETSLQDAPTSAPSETVTLDAKLRAVFELHTSRRLRPKKIRSDGEEEAISRAFIDQGPAGADSASSSRASSTTDLKASADAPTQAESKPSQRNHLRALGVNPSGVSSSSNLTSAQQPLDDGKESVSSGSESDEDNVTVSSFGKAAVPRWAVSIPSQRRFVGYWARVLANADVRSSIVHRSAGIRHVRIVKIDIDRLLASNMPAKAGVDDNKTEKSRPSEAVTIQLARYDQDFEARVMAWERAVRSKGNGDKGAQEGGDVEGFSDIDVKSAAEQARTFDWGDTHRKDSASGEDSSAGAAVKGEPRLEYFATVREAGRASVDAEGDRFHVNTDDAASKAAKKGSDTRTPTPPRLIRHSYRPGDAATTTTRTAPSVPTWAKFAFGGQKEQKKVDATDATDATDSNEGLVVDADRALMIKVLSGRTGASHALLPDMASCGYAWFIPAFETPEHLWKQALDTATSASANTSRVRCAFGPGEIDFRKGKRVAKLLGGEILRITIEWKLVQA